MSVELLAPAGDPECFMAAVMAGADAIYVGGSSFGARAYAKNFSEEELLHAIRMAHLYEKKVYMTVNTLVKEAELKKLPAFLQPYYEEGLDGVIMQDLGAVRMIRRFFPDLEIHASTQMTITGFGAANYLKKYGVTRIVPARELSLAELKRLKTVTGLELETFIHGSMCYCYSGQCLYSSMLGPRSGNRGRCAGPCRLPYQLLADGHLISAKEEPYQLSLKDLCTLPILPKLIEAGIDSFKIEGRMKTAAYVSFVTAMYRKYIDMYEKDPAEYKVDPEDIRMLQERFSRGSSQMGYYMQHNGRELLSLKKAGYQTFSPEAKEQVQPGGVRQPEEKKLPVSGQFFAHPGEPMLLTLTKDTVSVTVSGAAVEKAANRAATQEDVKKQLQKLGNTPFVLKELTCDMTDTLFLPNKELNELRRKAVCRLEEVLLSGRKRTMREADGRAVKEIDSRISAKPAADKQALAEKQRPLQVQIAHPYQLKALAPDELLDRIYVTYDCLLELNNPDETERLLKRFRQKKISIYLTFPAVTRQQTLDHISQRWSNIEKAAFDGYCAGNLEMVTFLRQRVPQKACVTDSGCYIFQMETAAFYDNIGVTEHVLPYELHRSEAKALASGSHSCILPVYGYIPVMETANCLLKTNRRCLKQTKTKAPEELFLIDRQKKKLRVCLHCDRCENTIYNALPLSLHKEMPEILCMPMEAVLLRFTEETAGQMQKIYEMYADLCRGEKGLQPVITEFTKGHFLKGVE